MQFDGNPAPRSRFCTSKRANQQRKEGLGDCSENDPWSHQEGTEKSCQLSLLKQRLRECFNRGLEAGDF